MTAEAVVIGAAQGIGEEIARVLAKDRAIVVADLKADAAETLAADLREGGLTATAEPVDITNPESVAALVAATPTVSQVAIVAGTFQATPSLEVTPTELQRVLAVNLIGVFDVARAYAASMIEKNIEGSIVAIGSIAARMPRYRQASYSASKAGMRQALRVLGLEVRQHGIRVNFVAPGPTATPMMDELASDHDGAELWRGSLDTFRPPIPDRRVGQPSDIADATAFLLSDQASHISLHDLYVDGGESLGL